MRTPAISVRIPPDKRDALKALAQSTHRSEAYPINAAVDAYLEAQTWIAEHVRRAVECADSPQAEWIEQGEMEKRWGGHAAEPVE
ncbi:MAG: CopG family ribbon-helix-helix protein [Deferrisomatales bacterium]